MNSLITGGFKLNKLSSGKTVVLFCGAAIGAFDSQAAAKRYIKALIDGGEHNDMFETMKQRLQCVG